MGRSINKRVVIAALIKSRIVGLHQNISIGSTDIIDTWEPLEEGLLILETTRHVSMITITFSKEELDESSKGGQEHVISVPLVQEGRPPAHRCNITDCTKCGDWNSLPFYLF